MNLPEPTWLYYWGYDSSLPGFILHTLSNKELKVKSEEFGFGAEAIYLQIGEVAQASVYNVLEGDKNNIPTELKNSFFDFKDIEDQGLSHPIFLPSRGCFGFVNGHLILANRHHMEIMYRLMNDKGWTWEDLMNAEQVWGWYTNYGDCSVRFSSDAGIMTSPKIKEECVQAFTDHFKKEFQDDGGGYGGKSKKTFGGNMEAKYGKPGEWGGMKTGYTSTIISPLPDPPEHAQETLKKNIFQKIIPGGGNPPPKKLTS